MERLLGLSIVLATLSVLHPQMVGIIRQGWTAPFIHPPAVHQYLRRWRIPWWFTSPRSVLPRRST